MKIIHQSSTSVALAFTYPISKLVKDPLSAYINGKKVGETKVPSYSFTNLEADTEYRCVLKNSEIEKVSLVRTKAQQYVLDVKTFHAKGDGITNDTLAIQSAIAFAPTHSIIYFPAGTYAVDAIYLKSNLTLFLHKHAELIALNKIDEAVIIPETTASFIGGTWEGVANAMHPAMVNIVHAENVLLTGEGVINGNASHSVWWDQPQRILPGARPRTLLISHSKSIVIEGVTIKNSPSWTIHPFCSQELSFLNLKISNPDPSPNTDGLNPEFCQNVQIIGVHFTVGDDCIAIKAGRKALADLTQSTTKNITIEHCFMEKGHGGVVMGSEMSGGIEGVSVKNCYFYQTDRGIRLKTRRGRGGFVRHIHIENVEMDSVMAPVVMNMYYNCCDPDRDSEYVWSKVAHAVDEGTPLLSNIRFERLKIYNHYSVGIFIYALPESKATDIRFNEIYIDADSVKAAKGYPAAMMADAKLFYGDGIFLCNVREIYFNGIEMNRVNQLYSITDAETVIGLPDE